LADRYTGIFRKTLTPPYCHRYTGIFRKTLTPPYCHTRNALSLYASQQGVKSRTNGLFTISTVRVSNLTKVQLYLYLYLYLCSQHHMEPQLYSFLTTTHYMDVWSIPQPGLYTPTERTPGTPCLGSTARINVGRQKSLAPSGIRTAGPRSPNPQHS
jgi:hypothetical protein